MTDVIDAINDGILALIEIWIVKWMIKYSANYTSIGLFISCIIAFLAAAADTIHIRHLISYRFPRLLNIILATSRMINAFRKYCAKFAKIHKKREKKP